MHHEFVNTLCPSVTVHHGEGKVEGETGGGGEGYLLKAVWVQLSLVYYLNRHLRRDKMNSISSELNSIK